MSEKGLTTATLESAFRSIRTSLPDSQVAVVADASSGTGIKTNIATDGALADYGFMEDYKFSVRVLASEFSDVKVSDLITVDGTRMLVLDMDKDRTDATLKLHLGDEHA